MPKIAADAIYIVVCRTVSGAREVFVYNDREKARDNFARLVKEHKGSTCRLYQAKELANSVAESFD